jgi:hypothetical protein
VLRLKLFLIDSHKFLPASRIFPKAIVGNPVKPRGKARFAAKTPDILVGAQEGLLSQVVCESDVGPGKLA